MILIDENLSYKLAARIEADYKGTQAVSRVESLGEGAPDRLVWEYAKAHNKAILTKDKDFVDFWSRFGPPPKVIHIKIGNARLPALESLISNNRSRINQFLTETNDGLLTIQS
ncbi:DUF5615 family PIN-like protein [Endozoicomonas sp. ALD040]|uniref:DUF5615 family PIN-like protein n=1 Tax=unclassified Endozoicomonas TaxID=2644528 RepID=UPI003BB03A29